MAILSVSEILTYIQTFIKAKHPQVDVTPGSDLYDLLFYSSAQVARRVFEEIEKVQNNQSVLSAESDALDLLAKNYNVTRRSASYATGEVTFYTPSFTSDITIPANTIVGTRGTNLTPSIRFRTVKSAGMSVANKSIYYDSTAVRYQVDVSVTSELAGTIGNVDSQGISEVISSVPNITGVVNNAPTSGGTESESNASIRQRCLQAFTVSNIGTIYGYRKLLTDNFEEVADVTATGPFDANAIRQTGVDVFVIVSDIDMEENLVQTTESFTFTTGDPGYTPVYRPAISIDTLLGTSLGVIRTFIPYPQVDADFQFIRDYTGERALSVESADRFEWMPLGIMPTSGTLVHITYTYNQKVQDLQEFMDLDENKVVGADALVKTGLKASTYLTLTVSYFPNVDTVSEKQKVISALTQYLSEFKFGEDLELSDLVIVAQTGTWTDFKITGVDYVVFAESQCYVYIEEKDATRYMSNGVINILINEYVRTGAITIV